MRRLCYFVLLVLLMRARFSNCLDAPGSEPPSKLKPACCQKFVPVELKDKKQVYSQIKPLQTPTSLQMLLGNLFAGHPAQLFCGAESPCQTISSAEFRYVIMSLQL
jgi:hypothetical protein